MPLGIKANDYGALVQRKVCQFTPKLSLQITCLWHFA